MTTTYHVEQQHPNIGWWKIPFAESRWRAYCDGYVNAIDSHYPSDPCRIVRTRDGVTEVVRVTKGRGEVRLN